MVVLLVTILISINLFWADHVSFIKGQRKAFDKKGLNLLLQYVQMPRLSKTLSQRDKEGSICLHVEPIWGNGNKNGGKRDSKPQKAKNWTGFESGYPKTSK